MRSKKGESRAESSSSVTTAASREKALSDSNERSRGHGRGVWTLCSTESPLKAALNMFLSVNRARIQNILNAGARFGNALEGATFLKEDS